jgi:autotransporter-associated beta strand protein
VSSLSRVNHTGDGSTIVETVGGKECRGNAEPTTTHRYMYFNVNNAFSHQLVNGDVTIEVEYYDNTPSTVLGLQYDGSSAAYTNHPQPITTTGSNTWRRVRFEISNAYFGGRQNGGADFRLNFNGKKLNVNRVWVRLPEGRMYPFTWTNATAGPALNWSQNANWLGGIVGQSDLTSTVRILPGQTLPGGTIPISNNLNGLQLGTLHLGGTASSSADSTVTLSGNALSLGGTAPTIMLDATKTTFGLTYEISAPVTLLGTTRVSGNGDAALRISGPLSGSGGLDKTNAGTLTLAGANTYLGNTTVNEGALELAASAQLKFVLGATSGTNNRITGAGTATLNGAFVIDTAAADALDSGTWILENVATLTGPYGSTFSVAGFDDIGGDKWEKALSPTKKYTFDETSGVLTLATATGDGFSVWISGTFANGQVPADQRGLHDDSDNDGIPNLIEYALAGQDPTVANPAAGTFTGTTLSFSKRAATTGLTYAIQESTDLGILDDWMEVTGASYVNDTDTISFTLTPGTPAKNFLRLKVTQEP